MVLAGCSSSKQPEQAQANQGKQTTTQTNQNKQTEQQQTASVLPSKPANTLPVKVLRTVDGDTLKVSYQGKEETVRLILVDTPETVKPNTPVQPFGKEASDFTKAQLTGQTVELELDAQERDQYGRLLAYVWYKGSLYNAQLLEKGYARVAVFPPNTKYVDQFRHIQKKAQDAQLGIWSIENYVTDRGFQARAGEAQTPKDNGGQTAKPNTGSDCSIKGNINSKGEKIYHLPGQQFYDKTNPERLFCTEEEAKAAGYRKSLR
nr:thermonuclease family protein [Ectobacillus ponti]